MKIIKMLQNHKNASEEEIKAFLYKNMSKEMLIGLEYDDLKTIKRAMKLFGIEINSNDLENLKNESISEKGQINQADSEREDKKKPDKKPKNNHKEMNQAL